MISFIENGANYKNVDNKRLRNWFKFEWENKCKSRIYNEPCDAQTRTHKTVQDFDRHRKMCWSIQHNYNTDATPRRQETTRFIPLISH